MKTIDFWSGKKSLLSCLFIAALGLLRVDAQPITLTPANNNLYDTGFSGMVLAGANQPDTHYELLNYGNGIAYQANPLAGGWVANSSTSQWITILNNTTTGPSISYDYRLYLTNIPAGSLVTIGGQVAADDNVTVSGNGSSPFFSNSSPGVVSGHYSGFTTLPTTTFVSGTVNYLDLLVTNSGGGPTGLNLQLFGSFAPLTSTAGLNIQFSPTGLTSNQTAILGYVNHLNAIGVTDACFSDLTTALLFLNNNSFGEAMDQLSPEKLDVFTSIAFNNASFLTQDLDDYLAHRRNRDGYFQAIPGGLDTSGLTLNDPTIDPQLSQIYSHLLAWSPAPAGRALSTDAANPLLTEDPTSGALGPKDGRWNVFLQGDVVLGEDLSNQDLAYRDMTTSSFEIGSDYQLSKNFLVGAFFNYSHTDTALDNNGSSATVDTYSPGIYASYARDGWYGNALADYGHNAYAEQRSINIGTYSETASGAPEGDQETVNIDGGRDFHTKNWTYGPTMGFQYTHLSIDSFSETGGCSSDLAVEREAADSFRSRIGGHVIYETRSGGLVLTPFLDASWQHEFLDNSRGITSSFSEIGNGQFTVFTPNPGRESALLATGLNLDLDHTTTVFANYEAQIDPDTYFGQSVIVGVKLGF